jgi:PGF-CTERM protein
MLLMPDRGHMVRRPFVAVAAATLVVAAVAGAATVSSPASARTADGDIRLVVEVVLDSAPDGLRTFSVAVNGPGSAEITAVEPGVTPGNLFEVTAGGVGESSVTARGVDLGDVDPTEDSLVLYTVTYEGDVALSDLSLDVEQLTDDAGDDIDTSRVSLDVRSRSTLDGSGDGSSDGSGDSDDADDTPTPTPTAPPTTMPPTTTTAPPTTMPPTTTTPPPTPDQSDGSVPGFGPVAALAALLAVALLARRV